MGAGITDRPVGSSYATGELDRLLRPIQLSGKAAGRCPRPPVPAALGPVAPAVGVAEPRWGMTEHTSFCSDGAVRLQVEALFWRNAR
jgi:hypothetical protein